MDTKNEYLLTKGLASSRVIADFQNKHLYFFTTKFTRTKNEKQEEKTFFKKNYFRRIEMFWELCTSGIKLQTNQKFDPGLSGNAGPTKKEKNRRKKTWMIMLLFDKFSPRSGKIWQYVPKSNLTKFCEISCQPCIRHNQPFCSCHTG